MRVALRLNVRLRLLSKITAVEDEIHCALSLKISGSASLFVLVGLIGRLVDKRACKKTWIGLPGQARGFLRSSGTAIVG